MSPVTVMVLLVVIVTLLMAYADCQGWVPPGVKGIGKS